MLTFALWPGCGGRRLPSSAPSPVSHAGMPSNMAPPPFTAEQLRSGLPVGTVISYSMNGHGLGSYVQQYRVVASDTSSVTMVSVKILEDGRTEESAPTATPWTALAAHAHFPADRTRVFDAQATTYAGTFATRAYEVTDPSGVVSTFYFALDQPGPPVLMTTEIENRPSTTMSLMKREMP